MTTREPTVCDLPDALRDGEEFAARLADRRPAVFLDYDGVLTPIVDRPDDAVMSGSMRAVVRALAQRCSVCVVSGRDRPIVQQLMGVDNLVVAGSHGFDIWSPQEGTIAHDAAAGFEDLISEVNDRLRTAVESIPGVVVEPKRASVARRYARARSAGGFGAASSRRCSRVVRRSLATSQIARALRSRPNATIRSRNARTESGRSAFESAHASLQRRASAAGTLGG